MDRTAALKAREDAFASARTAAFAEAKSFVHRKEPTQAAVQAAARAGKRRPPATITRTPYATAHAALYEKHAPKLLRYAAGESGRKQLKKRIDAMLKEALASVRITDGAPAVKRRSPYVSPVSAGTLRKRTDSGVDFQGEPGEHVLAIGKCEVTSSRRVGGFGMLVVYRLLEGPRAGQHIYVGHAQPLVKKGQVVEAGTPVARLKEHAWGLRRTSPHSRGWCEVGFAAGPLGLPQSYKERDPGVEHDLSTKAGVAFSTFLRRSFGI